MDNLPGEILRNGIHYTLVGDYYFPTCTLLNSNPVIGRWADLYEGWLQETHPDEYTKLIWNNELPSMLHNIQQQAAERLVELVRQMAEAEGVTERLKSANQLEWVGQMHNIRSCAEEIIACEIMKKD